MSALISLKISSLLGKVLLDFPQLRFKSLLSSPTRDGGLKFEVELKKVGKFTTEDMVKLVRELEKEFEVGEVDEDMEIVRVIIEGVKR